MDQLFKSIAWVLAQVFAVTHSYGISIVGLTIAVMIITTPLTIKGTKSMMKMQRLQPELKKIQERNKANREVMNQELMAFYKANSINPVGGCLPMFIQLPVFAVLYRVLTGLTRRVTDIGSQAGLTAAQIRDSVPFSLTPNVKRNFEPGYISKSSELYESLSKTTEMRSFGFDLSDNARSAISSSLSHALPYLILIAIVAVTGVIQQRQIQGRSAGASSNSQQQMLMKIMPFFMPIISFTLSAGLVLYFVVSNLWRVGQQAFITRTLYGPNAPAVVPIMPTAAVVESTGRETSRGSAPSRAGRSSGSNAGSSIMGRDRRGSSTTKSARLPAAAKKQVPKTPTTSGRVTKTGSSANARPAKKKKRS